MSHTGRIEAFRALSEQVHQKAATADALKTEARSFLEARRIPEAVEKLLECVHLEPRDEDAWHELALAYLDAGQSSDALEASLKALELEPGRARYHRTFGQIVAEADAHADVVSRYSRAFAPNTAIAASATDLARGSDADAALRILQDQLERAAAERPDYAEHLALGNCRMARAQPALAVHAYEAAGLLRPDDALVLRNLAVAWEDADPARAACFRGLALARSGHNREAIVELERCVNTSDVSSSAYLALADCYMAVRQPEKAAEACRASLRSDPGAADAYDKLAMILRRLGLTDDAIAVARDGLRHSPNDARLVRRALLTVPIIYRDEEEIRRYRAAFERNIDRLVDVTPLATASQQRAARRFLDGATHFHLAYQGEDDRQLQVTWGRFATRIMAANFPQWTEAIPMPPLDSGRIRVGYASAFFRSHSVANTTLGWLKHADRRKFSIHCYHFGDRADYTTARFRRYSDVFHHLPGSLEQIAARMRADNLHVLVYPDLGMHPLSTQLAALRLAPIQATSWGHPVTSGLPTVEFYLSGALMEPPNGQDHYSEHLIPLPHLGVAYEMPAHPSESLSRGSLGIRDDAVVYLSCQSLFKYLPRHDHLFPEIAAAVPEAQFVFLRHSLDALTAIFRERLYSVFAAHGLSGERHCLFLPQQDYVRYMGLFGVADVYLDTLEWSGANTTFEAIASGLPIVTMPGRFMRGRHTYAALNVLGVEAGIAASESDYVAIAAKLGHDVDLRHAIGNQILAARERLYEDRSCVTELEAFYLDRVRNGRNAGDT